MLTTQLASKLKEIQTQGAKRWALAQLNADQSGIGGDAGGSLLKSGATAS
jgi:hypothetical protein